MTFIELKPEGIIRISIESRSNSGSIRPKEEIRIPSISVTSRRTPDVPPTPGTRTGSYSFHFEKFRKSYGIFRNRYHPAPSLPSQERGARGHTILLTRYPGLLPPVIYSSRGRAAPLSLKRARFYIESLIIYRTELVIFHCITLNIGHNYAIRITCSLVTLIRLIGISDSTC